MSVGSRIKELRENKGLSRNELANLLGVTVGAISNYENEVSSPKEPILFKIMDALNCDANYLFQDALDMPVMKNSVSVDEFEHIKKYRGLDDHGREIVDFILNKEHERYMASINEKPDALRIYTYMKKIAAAGNGFYFDDIPTETIEAPYMEGADFIIGVSGDSMEPTYNDGDLVYVEKRQILNTGEVGIFIVNNECYIKEVGEDGLLSHNPKYKTITGTEDIHCIGKVLGKVDMNA
jgi:repressor LexA